MKNYRIHYAMRFSDWSYTWRPVSWIGKFNSLEEATEEATKLVMEQGMLDDDIPDYVYAEEVK